MTEKSVWEELDDIEDEDIDDWEDPDETEVTEEEIRFAKELFDFLQELINVEDDADITEEFMSDRGAKKHFEKHCLGHHRDERVSKRTSVYYDFKDVSQYKEYERKLTEVARGVSRANVETFISLLDKESVEKWLQRLFEGDVYIAFTPECGLHNSKGRIYLMIHSFASDVTRNYRSNDTIDIMVKSGRGKTITLYAVDANYFETKLNNIIRNYYNGNIEPFKINR